MTKPQPITGNITMSGDITSASFMGIPLRPIVCNGKVTQWVLTLP